MMLLLFAFAATVLFLTGRSAPLVRRLIVAVGVVPLLGVPCAAQMVWARRDPDMSQGANAISRASNGSAYDASRGRHVLFVNDWPTLSSSFERVFGFDGENWTTTTVPSPGFGYGTMTTEDPTGRGRIVRVAGIAYNLASRWNPNTGTITPLPGGPLQRAYGAFRYAPGIGAVQFGGTTMSGVADDHTWIWDGVAWNDATGGIRPGRRTASGASRGGAGQPFVLFGGTDPLGVLLADTWSFDGANWTQHAPATVPAARTQPGMAYDPVRNRVVMFGGYGNGAANLRDTWEWDGTDWHAIVPPNAPPAGAPDSLNWDPLRSRVVLAGIYSGGSISPNLPIDTWEWDGADWTQLNGNPTGAHVVSPRARLHHVLAYDSVRHRMIEYGGLPELPFWVELNDIWESESRVWQQRFVNPPHLTHVNSAATLRSTGMLCLVPGRLTSTYAFNELWRWNGQSWSSSPLSASPIFPQHQVMGSLQSSQLGWVLVRLVTSHPFTGWTSDLQIVVPFNGLVQPMFPAGGPSPRTGSVMIQPTSAAVAPNKVWLFGGFDENAFQYQSDLWELRDTGVGGNLAWTNIAPAAGSPTPQGRYFPAAAYHDRLNRLFVMGGAAPGLLGDTWMFDVATRVWTQLGSGPSARHGAAMVYDPSIDRLVLTGGLDATGTRDDIWEHDGTSWTQRTTPGRPSPRHNHSFVYDRSSHAGVLFGGHDGQTSLGDTWIHDGARWTPILAGTTSPAPRLTHAACFVEQGGATVMFGGTTDGIGELGDTWRLDWTGWTQGASGPPSRVNPAMVYAIVQGQPSCLLFGGYRQGSYLGDTWRYLPAANTWQPLAAGPPARDIHAMAWDRMRNVVVMFGGRSVTSFFADDTWEFSCATATWSQRNPAHRPPGRWNGTMDFDQSRGRTVLFGGYNGGYLNDVWEWDGSDWTQRAPETDAPGAREDATMTYDADRGRMAMFGGWNGSSLKDDLWFLNARIDRAGAGNTTQPTELRFHNQPALGQQLQLGFANPQGIGLYTVGFGPLQQPLGALPVPPLCEASSIWATFASYLVLGTSEPNIAWNVPNTPLILGVTLAFQAFAVQPAGCWRATDALHVRF